MGVELFETVCNWRTITNFKNSKDKLPTIESRLRGPVCEKNTSVLLEIPKKPDLDIPRLRDWMAGNFGRGFAMYNRFEYTELDFRVERRFIGTNFRFSDQTMAATFKIFWI